MIDKIVCTGRLRIFSRKEGESAWTLVVDKQNLVVNSGLALIADRLKDNVVNALSHIAVGTGTMVVSATDTALQTELFRKAFDNVDTPGAQLVADTTLGPAEGNGTWGECGIFNAGAGGTMYNRINVTYTKNAGEETKLEFTLTYAAA